MPAPHDRQRGPARPPRRPTPDPRRAAGRTPVVEPPAGTDPERLAPEVRRELRVLRTDVADLVARHLVAAGELVDTDPAAAYVQARAAKALAGRLGAVREAVGITAYQAGDFAVALAELRAARRISGSPLVLPLLADCERALGRPERAVELARDPDARGLDPASRVELAVVLAGARRDLGQPEAAVVALQIPELESGTVDDWTVRLWYAYADALLAAGRREEAREWFLATMSIDEDDETDAAERLAGLDRPGGPDGADEGSG